jgi:hypothetical protein
VKFARPPHDSTMGIQVLMMMRVVNEDEQGFKSLLMADPLVWYLHAQCDQILGFRTLAPARESPARAALPTRPAPVLLQRRSHQASSAASNTSRSCTTSPCCQALACQPEGQQAPELAAAEGGGTRPVGSRKKVAVVIPLAVATPSSRPRVALSRMWDLGQRAAHWRGHD